MLFFSFALPSDNINIKGTASAMNGWKYMKLDGFGLFVKDMSKMIAFYRDVLGFEIKEGPDASNVLLVKDGVTFLLYGRKDFEEMTQTKFTYPSKMNGQMEIALSVGSFEEVDIVFQSVVTKGAVPVMKPTTEPWGQRTSYIADPEGNLIEIGSFGKPLHDE